MNDGAAGEGGTAGVVTCRLHRTTPHNTPARRKPHKPLPHGTNALYRFVYSGTARVRVCSACEGRRRLVFGLTLPFGAWEHR